MLDKGPIPAKLHGLIEYVAGVLFVAAPFLLGFDEGGAVASSIIVGVVILAVAAGSEGPTGLIDQVPIAMHVTLDYLLAALLIAAPFLFRFSDEGTPTAWFIAFGIVHLLVTIGTCFLGAAQPARAAAADEPAR
ncbi:MAG: hypothetical protein CYG61_09400 [Actinobacteria bacterium]|nr:MAG: hypothetical protein CYG61_09400 [Actinomycetota bacterium]